MMLRRGIFWILTEPRLRALDRTHVTAYSVRLLPDHRGVLSPNAKPLLRETNEFNNHSQEAASRLIVRQPIVLQVRRVAYHCSSGAQRWGAASAPAGPCLRHQSNNEGPHGHTAVSLTHILYVPFPRTGSLSALCLSGD